MSPEVIPHRNINHRVVKYLRKLLDSMAEVYESHPITLDNSEPEPDIAIVQLPETIYDLRSTSSLSTRYLLAHRDLKSDVT